MANPVAYFTYNADGLGVTFKNLSQNITGTTTYLWNFGDGQTSILKDPTNTYTVVGFFDVILTLTDGAEINAITIRVGVNEAGKPELGNFNLIQLVTNNLPTGVTLDTTLAVSYIRGWQEYLFPLVDPPTDEAYKYDETSYEPLVNQLIGKLVTVDIILQGAKSYLAGLGNNPGSSTKDLKKVVTGPAESEWFSGSDMWYSIMRQGGILDGIQSECCVIAARICVFLPFCPAQNKVITPQVSRNCKTVDLLKNTFK